MHDGSLVGLLAVGVLALAGCSTTDAATAGPSPAPSDTTQPAPSPTSPPAETALAVDWTGAFDLSLPNGWSVQDCEGDRLDACISDGDVLLGDVELLIGYPLDDTQLTPEDATVLAALAEGFIDDFREDRTAGCPVFSYVADDVRDATVGGQPAKRAAFRLVADDGRIVERVINHLTLHGDTYAIVTTDAYVADGGCLGPSETDASFVPADLATLEGFLDRIVADSPLPPAPAT